MAASTGGDTEGDPGIRTMRDVILSPAVRDADARVRFAFGAHDAAGRYLDAFLLVRVYGTSARPAVPAGPPERHVGEAIYAGPLLPQFGHFLLESLARLWALRDAPAGLPILWHVVDPRLRPWQRDIFAMVGLDPRRFVMIDRVTTVGRLLVPDPGFRIRLDCHPRQMAALAAVPARPLDPAKRVWLSRSRLPPAKVGVEEEALLEDRLRAGGWTIFHPETASIGAR